MNRRSSLSCLLVAVSSNAFASSQPRAPHIPFAFVENRGEARDNVRYVGAGPEFKTWFEDNGVVFQQGSATIRMEFRGGSGRPVITASDPTGARANYLRGENPADWQTGLPMFNSLHYNGIWPGIEARFKADDCRAKAEYVVRPGASVSQIRLDFDGRAEIQQDGSLLVTNQSGRFREDKPILFQYKDGMKKIVPGAFRKNDDGSIGFLAADYDRSKELIVDPTILFSGSFGGSAQTTITGVAVNSYYNVIVSGWTISTDLAASSGVQKTNKGGVDAFVAAFSPAGGGMIYCTYIGGSGDDRAFGVTVDSANDTYITGWTSSSNFPLAGPFQSKLGGLRDAFVAKLNPAGNALLFSTYLGGTGTDAGNSIVLDSTGAVIIAGDTASPNLPASAGAFQRTFGGTQDGFVAKLSPAGNSLSFLTYLGGSSSDHAAAVKVNASNQIYVAGNTYSQNFPVLHAAQPQNAGGQDAFVTKMAGDGSSLFFSTYYGGSGGSPGAPEEANALLVVNGWFAIAGTTSSVDLPITAVALQKTFGGGNTDGFLASYLDTGVLARSSYFGGSSDDGINAMGCDYDNVMFFAGYTNSTDFPTKLATQSASGGGMDAFLLKASAAKVYFSTYIGGAGSDSATAIAVDSRTSVVVVGTSNSNNFPASGNVGHTNGAALSSFITKVGPNFNIALGSAPNLYFDVWANSGYNGPNITLNTAAFGMAGDIPLMGDWTGSGIKRMGVFRKGTWLLDVNNNGILDASDFAISFGQAGDIPVVGDWNGSGRIKLGLFRQGSFILDLSGHLAGAPTGLTDAVFSFGLPGDIPIVADWSNSGTTKVGVFRNGTWLIDYNGDQTFGAGDKTYVYGQAGDIPVTGDWATNAQTKIGVYRNGTWMLDYNGYNALLSGGIYELYIAFGGAGYTPLVY